MPIIRVEMWKGRTKDQKAELARAITDAMVAIAQTSPESTIIIFDDVERENWAENGRLAIDE
ncbi:MAG TPA: tautomerase family protein [Dehalococcoidia bacterium]|nr:tautomerase family protein [Dehalococcoidia bacterium]